MILAKILKEHDACHDAVEWIGSKGLKTAWNKCERGDWMLWALGKLDLDRKTLVRIVCDCAEPALQYVPEGELRPAEAIRVARLWCDGNATIDEVKRAAYAAADAACAAYVACAAAHAAHAAASLKHSADIVRKYVSVDEVKQLMIDHKWETR